MTDYRPLFRLFELSELQFQQLVSFLSSRDVPLIKELEWLVGFTSTIQLRDGKTALDRLTENYPTPDAQARVIIDTRNALVMQFRGEHAYR